MNLVCRKLRLVPGDRVIEAGCGWGALALYMARHYGASVRAFNVSPSRLPTRGGAHRTRASTGASNSWRTTTGTCAGPATRSSRWGCSSTWVTPDYSDARARHGRHAHGARPRAAALHRTQPAGAAQPVDPASGIFPGAYAPTLGEVFEHVLEPPGFSVLDVENLRLHYAKTLEHWPARFESAADRMDAMFDEPFVRAWRLYLAGSQAAFTTGCMQLFQIVFARGASNEVPWTRVSAARGADVRSVRRRGRRRRPGGIGLRVGAARRRPGRGRRRQGDLPPRQGLRRVDHAEAIDELRIDLDEYRRARRSSPSRGSASASSARSGRSGLRPSRQLRDQAV